MGVQAVHRQAEQGAVHGFELVLLTGQGGKFRGADRCEIGRMGEEDQPAAAIVGQPDRAVRRARLEIRRDVANTQ